MARVFTFILFLLFISCQTSKMKADLIVTNAVVYTVDGTFSKASSFAVNNGNFIAIGTNREILQKYQSEKTINADGQFIYPGFNDAHCHFYGLGMNLLKYADLSGTKSKEEIVVRLKKHYQKFGGDWLLGRGWDQNDWLVKEFPTKADLDESFPDVPVYLYRIDGHAGWCNSKALGLAGISKAIAVQGGEMITKHGKPTGVFIDAAKYLIEKIIPEPDEQQIKQALLLAQEACFNVGLTSVTDCGLSKEVILLIDELHKSGKLKMRINAMMDPSKENFEFFLKSGIYKTDKLQVNTLKLYADGALGSRGALMLEEYSDDPGNKGLLMNDPEWFREKLKLAYDANYQVATHCIGDSANHLMLDLYSEFLKTKNNRRWRIEHAQVIHKNDVQKFTDFSIIPSIQASHATSDMYWAEERLGKERLKGAYIYQDLLKTNGWIPNGTDFPVEKIDPLLTFYASVFRQDLEGWPEGGFQAENALTREQALRSITIWAAKSEFQEKEKGSIEVGKKADFVILDKDLMKALPIEIPSAKVIGLYCAGEKL